MGLSKIQYQTADIVSPPYSKAVEISVLSADNETVKIKYDLWFLNRDQISKEEIEDEGFTDQDDLHVEVEISEKWLTEAEKLLTKTTASKKQIIDQQEDLLLINANGSEFYPKNFEDWFLYFESIQQAVIEAQKLENPLNIAFLKIENTTIQKFILEASFKNMVFETKLFENGKFSESSLLPWSKLPEYIDQIYSGDFEDERAMVQQPTSNGVFVNLGTNIWYEYKKTWKAKKLPKFIENVFKS